MSAWAYYSPLWLGAVIAAVAGYGVIDQFPAVSPWLLWSLFVGACLAVGVQCQIVMVGVQGIFAQVLPVPRGRSIRGGGAVLGGTFLLAWAASSTVAVLLRSEEMRTAPLVIGIVSLVCLAGFLITYVWCWPVAVRDFDKRAT